MKPINNKIHIKKEPLDEKSTRIKTEPDLVSMPCADWIHEKKKLVETIVALKSENQANLYQLKTIQKEMASMKTQMKNKEERFNSNINSLSIQLHQAKSQLEKTKADFVNKHTQDQKIIAELSREKRLLSAQAKQL